MTNEFVLTIKQNDSTLPMQIEATDTFVLKLFNLETQMAVVSTEGLIAVHDASNGQIKLTLPSALVNTLVSARGDKADRYYLKPTYRMAIDCTTVNNGSFIAKVPFVYVDR